MDDNSFERESASLNLYEGRIIHYREQAGLILRILIAVVGILITGVVSLVPEISEFNFFPFFQETVSQLQRLDYIGPGFARSISSILSIALVAFTFQFLRYGQKSIRSAYLTIHPDGDTTDWMAYTVEGPELGETNNPSDPDGVRAFRELQETKRHFQSCLESLKSAINYGMGVVGTIIPIALNQPETAVYGVFPMLLILVGFVIVQRAPLSKLARYVTIIPSADGIFIFLTVSSLYSSMKGNELSATISALILAGIIVSLLVLSWSLSQSDAESRRFVINRELGRFAVVYLFLAGLSFVGGGEIGEGILSTAITSMGVSSILILLMILLWMIGSRIRQTTVK